MRKSLLASVAATALLAGVVAAGAQRGPEAQGDRSPAASSQSQPRAGGERRGSPGSQSQQMQDRGGLRSGPSAPSGPRTTTGAGSAEDRRSAPDSKGDRLDRGLREQPGSARDAGRSDEKAKSQGAQDDRSKGQKSGVTRERSGTTGAAERDTRRENMRGERPKEEPRSGASQRSNERSTTGQTRARDDADRGDRREDRVNRDRNARDRDTERLREESGRQDRAGTREERSRSSTSVRLSSEQRGRIADVLSRERVRSQTNLNINVSVGARVPRTARLSALPRDVVAIYPAFRGYRYTVVYDDIVIVDPATYEVVEVIPRSGRATTGRAPSSERTSTRINLSAEKRRMIRETVIREQSVPRCEDMRVTVGAEVSRSIRFSPFPEVVVREVPEIREYRFCIHDQDVVLIDPDEYRIVEVID